MMRKVVALAIVLLFLVSLGAVPAFHVGYARAQEEPALWVRSYGLVSSAPGEYSIDMATAPNGDFVVVGISGGSWIGDGFFNIVNVVNGESQLWVLRLDSEGNIKWQKTYGIESWGNGVAVAPNGDILVTGGIKSLNGESQLWVLRLDSEGNIKWQKTYGSGVGKDIVVTSSGEIIVTGTFTLALDKWGNVKWAKNITGTALSFDTNSGNIVIVDGITVTYVNSKGLVMWRKIYRIRRDGGWGYGSVDITSYGDIIIAGYRANNLNNDSDAAVVCLDKEGNVKWAKSYGGSNWDWANSVVVADTGDVIVAGWTSSFESRGWDLWVLKLDLDGNVYWQKRYGGDRQELATSVVIDSEGNIVTSGFTGSFGNYYGAFWVLRLPPDGNLPPEGVQDSNFSYGDTNAVVEDINTQVTESTASVVDITAIVHNTNVEPLDTNAIVKTQYYLERGGEAPVATSTIKLVVGNVPVAFVDVEVWKDGHLVETATSDLDGVVHFTHKLDQSYKLRIMGEEYEVSDVIELNSDNLEVRIFEFQNITPTQKSTVSFKIVRQSDKKSFNGMAIVNTKWKPDIEDIYAPVFQALFPENETFNLTITDSNYPPISIVFTTKNSNEYYSNDKAHYLYIRLPYLEHQINELVFTEFQPFFDGYSFSNPDTEKSSSGSCYGIVSTLQLSYNYRHKIGNNRLILYDSNTLNGYMSTYEYNGLNYNRPTRVQDHIGKYGIYYYDNIFLSIILHQEYQKHQYLVPSYERIFGSSVSTFLSKAEFDNGMQRIREEFKTNEPLSILLWKFVWGHAVLSFGYLKVGDTYYFAVYNPNTPRAYSWLVLKVQHNYPWGVFYTIKLIGEDYGVAEFVMPYSLRYSWFLSSENFPSYKSITNFLQNYTLLVSPHQLHLTYTNSTGTYYGEFVNGRFYQSNIPYSAGFMEWSKENGNAEPFYAVIYPTKLDGLGKVEIKTLTPPGDLDPYTVMAIGEDRVTGFSVNSTVDVTTSDDGNGYLLVANGTGNVDISKFIITNSSYENTTLSFQGTNVTIQLNDTAVRADLNGDGVIDKTILLPEVEFTFSPGSTGINREITFNASESRGIESPIVNYTWSFGDGSTASGPVVTHSYSHPGVYTVTLTVTDENGTSVSLSKVIVIQPIISFVSPTPENNAVINKPYVFINITSNEPIERAFLEWNGKKIPMKKASSTSWYINMTNLKSGKYTFKVWGEDENDNWGVSETRTVTVELPTQVKTWTTVNTILALSHLWTAWFFHYYEEFNSLYANATAMNVSNETLQRALKLHNNATALILKAWHTDDINYIKEHLWKHVVFMPQVWNVRKAFLLEREAVKLLRRY